MTSNLKKIAKAKTIKINFEQQALMYVPPKRTEREDSLLWLAMGAAARVWRHTTLNGPAVLIDDVNATIDQHMTENNPDPELTNDERGQIWDLAFLIVEDAWDHLGDYGHPRPVLKTIQYIGDDVHSNAHAVESIDQRRALEEIKKTMKQDRGAA